MSDAGIPTDGGFGIALSGTAFLALKEIVVPPAKVVGKELAELAQKRFDEWKTAKQFQNLQDHFRLAEESLEHLGEKPPAQPTVEQGERLKEWMEGAKDAGPEAGALGELWQGILVRILLAKRDESTAINMVKQLSLEDAEMLLRFRSANANWEASTARDKYYLDRLKGLGLIETSPRPSVAVVKTLFLPPIFASLLSFIFWVVPKSHEGEKFSWLGYFMPHAFVWGIAAIFVVVGHRVLKSRYSDGLPAEHGIDGLECSRPTWIGELLLAAAPPQAAPKRTS